MKRAALPTLTFPIKTQKKYQKTIFSHKIYFNVFPTSKTGKVVKLELNQMKNNHDSIKSYIVSRGTSLVLDILSVHAILFGSSIELQIYN